MLKIPKFDGTSHTRNLLVTDRHSQVTSRALHQLHYHVCHRLCLEHVRVGESFCDLWGVWGASTHKAIISSSADRVIHHSVKVIVGHLASGLGHLVRQSTSDSLMRGTKFVVCHATTRADVDLAVGTAGRTEQAGRAGDHTPPPTPSRLDGVWTKGGESRRPHKNRSTSIRPGRMRSMSLANGLQNPHSPSIPASQVERQMAIQRNTDRTQTAWSSSEAGPFFFPPFLYRTNQRS